MRIIVITAIILFYFNCSLRAQKLVLESKSGFTISAYMVFPMGKAETSKGAFIFPSLLSNFKTGYGYSLQYYKGLNPSFNVGIRYSNLIFSNWHFSPESNVFNDAKASVQSISLGVTIKNLFHDRGLLNKWNFYLGLAPGLYLITVDAPNLSVSHSKTARPGLLVNGGIDYAINNNLTLSISGGYQGVMVKSSMYQEKNFQWCQAGIGLTFRLNKNQDYLRGAYE